MKKFLPIFFLLFLLPFSLRAASTLVSVEAGRERINAVEGILVLPPNVKVGRITLGGSRVLLWVKSPEWNEADHTISFAGLSPGGFSGTAPLFTVETLSGEVVQTGGRLFGYRNDGDGTELVLEYKLSTAILQEDQEPPEPFEVTISSSPDIFDGQDFISFATQDKGSGVARYEYASSWLFPPSDDEWQRGESPLKLSTKMLFQKIYVRAIDFENNAQTASVSGSYRYATIIFSIIIMLCVLLFLRRSFHSSSSSS
jgi:hypothetical protein